MLSYAYASAPSRDVGQAPWCHRIAPQRLCPGFHSIGYMAAIVPKTDDRFVPTMVIAENAQRRRAQKEIPAYCRIEPEPAGGEDAEKMPMGKEQNIAVDGAKASDGTVRPRSHVRGRFAAGTPVSENLPSGPLFANLDDCLPFVDAVIPFDEIAVRARDRAEAGQIAGSRGPLQRTGEYLGE